VWRFLSSYVLHSSPVVDDARGVLYFGGHDGRLISLSLATGDAVGCFTAGNTNPPTYGGQSESLVPHYTRENVSHSHTRPLETTVLSTS